MDWFSRASSGSTANNSNSSSHAATTTPQHPPRPAAAMLPQMQGDPTFLYGGYGYRPPTFGYAWNGASQPTSFCQLPASGAPSNNSPKALSKSVSAPDLQNPAAVQDMQAKAKKQQPQPHAKMQGTPPLPRHHHNKHLSHAGTPGGSAANTPSSSRASTPPRRASGISNDSFYIGMAAA